MNASCRGALLEPNGCLVDRSTSPRSGFNAVRREFAPTADCYLVPYAAIGCIIKQQFDGVKFIDQAQLQ